MARWARRNGYRLIVIKYTVKDVAAFLTKRLEELGVLEAVPV
jgi:hypothetical protein